MRLSRTAIATCIVAALVGCNNDGMYKQLNDAHKPPSSVNTQTPINPTVDLNIPRPSLAPLTADEEAQVKAAIASESAASVSEEALIHFMGNRAEQLIKRDQDRLTKIFDGINGSLYWAPGLATMYQSVYFNLTDPIHNTVVIRSTQDGQDNPSNVGLAVVGEKDGQRYAAMAREFWHNDESNDVAKETFKQIIRWLTRSDDQVKLSIVETNTSSFAYWHLVHWLDKHFPNQYVINANNECDGDKFDGCVELYSPDLIMINGESSGIDYYDQISNGLERAKAQKISYIASQPFVTLNPVLNKIYDDIGVRPKVNYWSKHHADGLMIPQANDGTSHEALVQILGFIDKLSKDDFDVSVINACDTNFTNCEDRAFFKEFAQGAHWFSNAAIGVDKSGASTFDNKDYNLINAALLLGDKYRQEIDYPVDKTDPKELYHAMYGDMVISYIRHNNVAQPDLGHFVTPQKNVVKGENANYTHAATTTDTSTLDFVDSNIWTTTGWYLLPGKKATLKRLDSSNAKTIINLNYHRDNTNRAYQSPYRAPLKVQSSRIEIPPQGAVTISSPYGGPIYIKGINDVAPFSVSIQAKGVAQHPTILDFSDANEIAKFQRLLKENQLPHIDLKSKSAEIHLRRDRFTNAVPNDDASIRQLLIDISDSHLNTVYTLAGHKIQGKSLRESLSPSIVAMCEEKFGDDCFDEQLHLRKGVQHVNYDQNAHCGSGCSGNPWDAAWDIDPTGWGDNHELGHNLQVSRMKADYATDAESWKTYSSRANENSNNIFPYYVKWKSHFITKKETSTITDDHMNQRDLFSVFMSDAAKLKDAQGNRIVYRANCKIAEGKFKGDRFESMWADGGYAPNNGYRMAFYMQMALRMHEFFEAKNGTGFDVFTWLYMHNRIFGQYANDRDWEAHKAELGFGLFPFKGGKPYGDSSVAAIPGNDFMLVSLSFISHKDWTPYFEMFGLRTSSLAQKQASEHGTDGKVEMGMYVIDDDIAPLNLSHDLTWLPLDINDATTKYPRDGFTPTQCAK